MAGHPEFAHDENIQRSIQGPGDFVPNRDATSRQGKYNHITAIGVLTQLFGQQPTCFCSISKWEYDLAQGFISGSTLTRARPTLRRASDRFGRRIRQNTAHDPLAWLRKSGSASPATSPPMMNARL
jgi:hypothetical protein